MANSRDERFWGLILQRIEEEKCILILGPDLSSNDGISMGTKLKEFMSVKSNGGFKYYHEDEFFSFADDADKEYAYYDIQQFYDDLPVSEIHHKIADIPFHLIVSLTPDILIRKAFEDKKLNYVFDYYNKEENPQAIGQPTKEQPLIYNLFGNIERESSLILTYDDLFDYLFAIFSKHELHQDLRRELQRARMILFVGFRYEKWYFKLITRVLNVHRGKLSHAPLKDRDLLPDVRNFYSDELKVKFLDYSSLDIINALHDRCSEKKLVRTKKKNEVMHKPEIYISYGWGGKSEETVDLLYKKLIERQYNVIRDKVNLGYKGNIKDFMEQIGTGKYVIVIISDKYLKSENCMYEMLEIKKNGDYYDRVFPIVLGDAKVYDEIDRIDYLNYWDDKVSELKKKVETLRDPVGKVRVYEKMNQYADINRVIDDITDMLRNMNTLTPDIHKETDFQSLISAIDMRLGQDQE